MSRSMSRSMARGLVVLVAFAGMATAGATSGPPPASAAVSPQVRIEQFKFGAASLVVPVGATVTWTNADEEPHTVTSVAGVFASPGLDQGEWFAWRFDAPGTYPYYCALHPHMRGQVIVR
jgi:plastocyanin